MADTNNREVRKQRLRSNMISSGEADTEEEIKKERKKRRRTGRTISIVLLVLVIIVALAAFLYLRFFKYTDYDTVWHKDIAEGSFVGYERYGSQVIKYSKDGASYIDEKGTEVWTESYEMKDPECYVQGDYAAIADMQGNTIEIFNKDGRVGTATTLLPITKAVISANGVCACIEEDNTASYITFFKKDGTALDVTIKTKLSGDGYPMDISLSPDGTQLMVAYQYLTGGDMKGRVVFYDFSEIGKNIPNRLVGGFDEPFAGSMIARVRFMNSVYSYAVADTGIYFFSSKNLASPELVKEIVEDDEIESVFHTDKYVGLILNNTGGTTPYRMEVYKPDGSRVLSKEFDFNYNKVTMDGDYVFLFDHNQCQVYNLAGVLKCELNLNMEADKAIKGKLPTDVIVTGTTGMELMRMR